MNCVELVGRLVRDPEVRGKCTSFTLAVDRENKEAGADFPRVVTFGKTAELVQKNFKKGRVVSVQGKILTGSYEGRNGKVYTTDVMANEARVIVWGDAPKEAPSEEPRQAEPKQMDFAAIDDDVPF